MKKNIIYFGIIFLLASPTLFGINNRFNRDNWQERQHQAFDNGLRASGNAFLLAPMDGAHGNSGDNSSENFDINLDNKNTDMNKSDLYQFLIGLSTTAFIGITALATVDLNSWHNNTKIPGFGTAAGVSGISYYLNKSITKRKDPSHYNKAGILVGALGFLSFFALKEKTLGRW